MTDIQKIITTVLDYLNSFSGLQVSFEMLHSKNRIREIVITRQVSMYFAKKYLKISLAEIGLLIGGKDHATVLHACKTVKNLYDTDKVFRNQINDLDSKIKEKLQLTIPCKLYLQIRLKISQCENGKYRYTLYGVTNYSNTRTLFMPVNSIDNAIDMVNIEEVDSLNINMDYRKSEFESANEPIEIKIG